MFRARVAVHEAAHAVAFVVGGFTVTEMHLNIDSFDPDLPPHVAGGTRVALVVPRDLTREQHVVYAAACLVGLVADYWTWADADWDWLEVLNGNFVDVRETKQWLIQVRPDASNEALTDGLDSALQLADALWHQHEPTSTSPRSSVWPMR